MSVQSLILEQARACEKCRLLDEKARAARKAYVEKYSAKRFFGSWGTHDNGLTLYVSLSDYLSVCPDAQPVYHEHEHQETTDSPKLRKCQLRYPPFHIGQTKPGYNVWIESSTPSVLAPVLELPSREEAA